MQKSTSILAAVVPGSLLAVGATTVAMARNVAGLSDTRPFSLSNGNPTSSLFGVAQTESIGHPARRLRPLWGHDLYGTSHGGLSTGIARPA